MRFRLALLKAAFSRRPSLTLQANPPPGPDVLGMDFVFVNKGNRGYATQVMMDAGGEPLVLSSRCSDAKVVAETSDCVAVTLTFRPDSVRWVSSLEEAAELPRFGFLKDYLNDR